MRVGRAITGVLLAAAGAAFACGETLGTSEDLPAPARDAGLDVVADDVRVSEDAGDGAVTPPKCDLDLPFAAPVPVTELNSVAQETNPHLTDDELRIVFQSRRENGGEPKFFVAERKSRTEPFGAPQLFPIYAFGDNDPAYAGDGLTLYFSATRGETNYDLWFVERTTLTGIWGTPAAVPGLVTPDNEFHPFFRAGGLWYTRIASSSTRSIWFAKQTSGAFAAGAKVEGLDETSVDDELPTPSADGLSIYFASKREKAQSDIWFARRTKASEPFAKPIPVTELNTSEIDVPSWLSLDGCRLYFVRGSTSDADAGIDLDIYVAAKPLN